MGRRRARSPRGGLAGGGQKGGFKAAFDAEVVREIEALIAPGAADRLDFEAVEIAARRRALSVAARAVEQRLNADTSDHAGPTRPCACGKPARYVDRRSKTFTSVLGELTLSRAYYHCETCGQGFCPRDRALGIEGSSLSPGVLRMVGLVGATVSFEEGHEFLDKLADVQVPAKHVERSAEALGREIAQDERAVVEKAHRRPRFVEDCVREMVRGVVEAYPELEDSAFVLARQQNLETIHRHNALAERCGLLGEIRAELGSDERSRHHVTMREWLEMPCA
jgi:hypothetical protein